MSNHRPVEHVPLFNVVLVANRGEIAVRIIKTLRSMGIRAVAVYSDADANARYVCEAHTAVRIGPAPAAQSYLSIPAIIQAALDTGAEAVHPGYGFLAENAEFASACEEAGLVFIGPTPRVIEVMGDKIRAKQIVADAGVPVIAGKSDLDLQDGDFAALANEIGYPVLLKPSAGGGGKGMRVVHEESELDEAVISARREALNSFGNDTLLVERFLSTPRHIEIQLLADSAGNIVHLGERECSLQRRHQKIIEESPSPLLTEELRARMGNAAIEVARSVKYTGAGTVEFIVSAAEPDKFFFMEMNTRLQVEHPVTEMVTGLNLVEWQVRIAAGESLTLSQEEVHLTGHAVEARIYAEDPAHGFIPTGGKILAVQEPSGHHVRFDSGVDSHSVVGSQYDPMLAKLVAWGPSREVALRRLNFALSELVVLGITTNIGFLQQLLADEDVRAGRLDTGLIERQLETLTSQQVPDSFLAAAAIDYLLASYPVGSIVDRWEVPDGWRLGAPSEVTIKVRTSELQASVRIESVDDGSFWVSVDDNEAVLVQVSRGISRRVSRDDESLELTYGRTKRRYRRALAADGTLWLFTEGKSFSFRRLTEIESTRSHSAEVGPIISPMPGTVLVLKVSPGDHVTRGMPLLVVEAMKMEHSVVSPIDGVVSELYVHVGQQVALAEVLAQVTPATEETS